MSDATRSSSSPFAAPQVAILCAAPRARTSAAAVALALAAAVGRSPALAAAAGVPAAVSAGGGTPAGRRTAARLRADGVPALPVGRLVWIAGRQLVDDEDAACDVGGVAAACAARLGRAAAAVAAPAALALSFPRTGALDRVLAWHDGVVVVREPEADDVLLEHVLASVAELGRPVAVMAPPARVAATLARAGLRAPDEAVRAVAALGLDGGARGGLHRA